MSPETLLQQFGIMVDAPNGVQKLRELILQLAVRGNLVPQDPSEEPASALLERIAREKQRLYQGGRLAALKNQSCVSSDEIPFELPVQWEWTRLATLGIVNPRNDLPNELTVAFCPMSSLPEDYSGKVAFEERTWGEIKKGYTHFADGDVVVAKITPCFQNGKAAAMRGLPGGAGAGTTELHVFRPIGGTIVPQYVLVFLKSPAFVEGGVRSMSGTAGQQRVSKDYFAQSPFPLPPLAEQRRIVAKVDELMAFCDRLEAQQQRRTQVRTRLNRSVLHQLIDASDDAEFSGHWQRLRENFHRLYDTPEAVTDLRQAILQLAVRGKLVPQDPSHEPACAQLRRIAAYRQQLHTERKISTPKPLPSVDEAHIPFEIPRAWAWARLGETILSLGDGPHFSPNYVSKGSGVPFLSTRNVRTNGFDLSDVKYVSVEDHQEFTKKIKPELGDILYTKGGTTGIAKVNDLPFDFSVWVHVAVLKTPKGELDPEYLALALNSPHCYAQSQRYTQGSSNSDLGLTRMVHITTPIPPLGEQHLIVAKVRQLMSICEALEESLTRLREKSAHLAASVVHHLTAA